MHVIGTAGHVDHGKSTLVEALTGIDPDRLKEEKEREMTIDLGFAWFSPGDGQDEIGIIDVPGHQDFIENMLSGVGGIDLALFVVAADEGVMPQTQEHLAILNLLEVKSGIVALTKVDLVDDPEWIELVTLDVIDHLSGTFLSEAPIIPVSARTGQGMHELKQTIDSMLKNTETRPDIGQPRMAVDRVFTLSGFGTIVTGTLIGGSFSVGDSVELQPSGIRTRIRGLQTHGVDKSKVLPGSRVAINLSGVRHANVARGDVVASPELVSSTLLCDAGYRQLPDTAAPLKHNDRVKLFIGSAEVMARIRVLGDRFIAPGQSGWLQLALSNKTPMLRNDLFVLRRPSPPMTIGGGRILDPQPGRQHRRYRSEVIAKLETLDRGLPEELLLEAIGSFVPTTLAAATSRSGLDNSDADVAFEYLKAKELIEEVGPYIYSSARLGTLRAQIISILDSYHKQYPLRIGMAREELRSRIGLTTSAYNPFEERLIIQGKVTETSTKMHLSGHEIHLNQQQQSVKEQALNRFAAQGVNSPSVKEIKLELGDDLYQAMMDLGLLHQVNSDVVYTTDRYHHITVQITNYLKTNGTVNAAQVRDMLDTSRKYAIALLEHMDELQITRREGDVRILTRNDLTQA